MTVKKLSMAYKEARIRKKLVNVKEVCMNKSYTELNQMFLKIQRQIITAEK